MNNLRDIIIEILAAAVSTAIICLIRAGIVWLTARCESEKVQLALQEFQTVLEDGVGFIEQTFVRVSKESGSWDASAQRDALQHCITYIRDNLTKKTTEILTQDKADIETWIRAKIEAYIQQTKTR